MSQTGDSLRRSLPGSVMIHRPQILVQSLTQVRLKGSTSRTRTEDRAAHNSSFRGWEAINALRKLHHLAVWLQSSPIHADMWRQTVGRSLGIDNATRWSSWHKVISVALAEKPRIV